MSDRAAAGLRTVERDAAARASRAAERAALTEAVVAEVAERLSVDEPVGDARRSIWGRLVPAKEKGNSDVD